MAQVSFHFLPRVSFLARPKPRISFLGLFLLRNSTETLATQARLVQMFDVGAWMKECRETLHELMHSHCFKFIKGNSKVVIYYRKWSKNEWDL